MRRSRHVGLVTVAALCLLGFGAELTNASPASLSETLEREALDGTVAVSLLFVPLDGEGPVVARSENQRQPPASVQKVVTSAAALDLLGPDYRFQSELLADGPMRKGRLEGNLYLRGNGDPFLVTERLWLLAHEAFLAGLRSVGGALVVEAEAIPEFETIRAQEDRDRPYAAPISRLAVNFNSLTFVVRPSEIVGGPATVWLDPYPVPRMALDAEVKTVAAGRSAQIRTDRTWRGQTEVWTFSGTIPVGESPIRIYRAASNPALLAGGLTAGHLRQYGIEVPAIREGKVPETAVPIASLTSDNVGSLIRRMNKYSNNFMADLLLASLGGSATGGSGRERVQAWLAERLEAEPAPIVVDGSGLSIANRISAAQVVAVLRWAEEREKVYPDLFASMARPGGDGTLNQRFDDLEPPAFRAKTGTLGDQGVCGIAGYLDHPEHGRYAFCILQRADPGSKWQIWMLRAREEQWLNEFVSP